MDFLKHILEFVMGPNMGVIFAALFGVSEALALIPSVESNSIFQAIVAGLKGLAGLVKKPGA